MKPVFKCDYCEFMGTEEKVREHEINCMYNYDRKSCHTCVHKRLGSKDRQWFYRCKAGKEIPEGKIFEFCTQYERKEKSDNLLDGLFDDLFS